MESVQSDELLMRITFAAEKWHLGHLKKTFA